MFSSVIFKSVAAWCAKNWRILAGLGAVVAVVLVLRWVHTQIDQAGYNRCQNEHATAQAEAAEAARVNIVKIGDEYAKEKQKLVSKGDSGHGVGDRVRDALDVLRSRNAD